MGKTLLVSKSQIFIAFTENANQHFPAFLKANDGYLQIPVALIVTLTRSTHTPVKVSSRGYSTVFIDPEKERTSHAPLHIARDLETITANKPFHILLTKISNKPGESSKHVIVAHTKHIPVHVTVSDFALLKADFDTMDVVHCKPSLVKNTQKTRHQEVKYRDLQKRRHAWETSFQLSGEYAV